MNFSLLLEVIKGVPWEFATFVWNNATGLRILRVVFGCLFGIVYVISFLADTVEKRRKKASPAPVATFLQEVAQIPIA